MISSSGSDILFLICQGTTFDSGSGPIDLSRI